jgi:hypothetical protein
MKRGDADSAWQRAWFQRTVRRLGEALRRLSENRKGARPKNKYAAP